MIWEFLILVIVIYLGAGLAMVMWDFRKTIYSLNKNHRQDFLEKPKFLPSLTVGTAVAFVFFWPIVLYKK